MHHDAFGEITYAPDEQAWYGRVSLSRFARYGQGARSASLPEAPAGFRGGAFPLAVDDDSGDGPSAEQVASFHYLRQHESDVCRDVVTQLLATQRFKGFLGWLNRLLGFERKSPKDLRSAVRCRSVRFSAVAVDGYVYVGFDFDTEWGAEVMVVYHPVRGAFWGDRSALDYLDVGDPPDSRER